MFHGATPKTASQKTMNDESEASEATIFEMAVSAVRMTAITKRM